MKFSRHPWLAPFALLLLSVYFQAGLWCLLLPLGWAFPVWGFVVLLSALGLVLGWKQAPHPYLHGVPTALLAEATPTLYQAQLKRLALQAKLPTPQVQTTVPPTAGLVMAIGTVRQAIIVVDAHFLAAFSEAEVSAILAHEVGHIALGHTTQLALLQTALLPLFSPLVLIITALIDVPRRRRMGVGTTASRVWQGLSYLVLPLTNLLVLVQMRRWEYAADRYAVGLVGKTAMLATLRCLHGIFMPEVSWGQISAFHAPWRQRISTHPSLPQRIMALWRG
ncbi:MAG: M48 family metalloprotease [Gammaproteobacteria bacterium]|nr:M48 family metalloprotease [Gammaproteobacteria bacterium]